MKIETVLAMFVLATAPVVAVNAQDAERPAPARYAFTCDTATPLNLTPVSFNFGLQNPANIGSQSSGAGAGKVMFNPLTVKFRADKNVVQLLQDVETGAHYTACTLTETVNAPFRGRSSAGGIVFKWDFRLVFPSTITAIGSDASNTASGGTDVPTGFVEAGFEYGAISLSVSQ